MRGEVFLDSGVFIAFMDRSDGCHQQAMTLFSTPPPGWCTSALVVAEAYGWFLHRLGEEQARSFRRLLAELPKLTILDTSRRHRTAVAAKLDRLRGCKLTYVDASSLVWLEQRKIRTVWGTDHHLAIEGAAVLPGSTGR